MNSWLNVKSDNRLSVPMSTKTHSMTRKQTDPSASGLLYFFKIGYSAMAMPAAAAA